MYMKIGYARVSTEEQNLNRQIDILKQAGCEKIYEEKISGTKMERPELNKMLDHLRTGDIIIIEELTRLSRMLETFSFLLSLLKKKVLISNQLKNLGSILQQHRVNLCSLFLLVLDSLKEILYLKELKKDLELLVQEKSWGTTC